MQTLTYEVKLFHFQAIPEIVNTLDKTGLIDCVVTYPSITKAIIQISPKHEDLNMDDALYIGSLIGQIEAMSLK